jgi:hypothetical protein
MTEEQLKFIIQTISYGHDRLDQIERRIKRFEEAFDQMIASAFATRAKQLDKRIKAKRRKAGRQ